MSYKRIPANKAKTKQVKDLIKKYPSLKIPIEIKTTNKAGYKLALIWNRINGNGETISRAKFPVIGENAWNAMKSHNAKDFGCHILVVLHDPTIQEKKTAEDTETEKKTAEK